MGSLNVSVVGAGKVGTAMAVALSKAGHRIVSVHSRTQEKARLLAKRFNYKTLTGVEIPTNTDFIIISVQDNHLKEVISNLIVPKEAITVHTAGSFGLEVFDERSTSRNGVFYPLQTFTENRELEFKDIPLFIESDSDSIINILRNLASDLGAPVYHIDSNRRRMLHLAAVFVSNFVNHMYYAGQNLCKEADIPFSVFEPLIKETFYKAISIGPNRAQTGPALRNDKITIEKHLDLLSFSPELGNIYKTITDSIIKHYTLNNSNE